MGKHILNYKCFDELAQLVKCSALLFVFITSVACGGGSATQNGNDIESSPVKIGVQSSYVRLGVNTQTVDTGKIKATVSVGQVVFQSSTNSSDGFSISKGRD